MRNRFLYLNFLLSSALLCGCNVSPVEQFDLIIENTNLIDGTDQPVQKAVSVAIDDGVIVAIGSLPHGNSRQTIDGSNKYLIPGLFDCHVHTVDFERDFPRFMHYGITSIFITGGSTCTNEYFAAMRNRGNQDSLAAPFVFHTSQHFTLEGRHPAKTYPSGRWQDGKTIFYLKDTTQIKNLVREVTKYPITGIKLTIEDGPAPPFVERMPASFIEATVRAAALQDLEVYAHVSDNIELEMAISGGVQNLLHYTGVNIDPDNKEQLSLLQKFKARDPNWVTTLMIDKSFLYPLHPEWFKNEEMLKEYRSASEEITAESAERAKIYANILKEEYGVATTSLADFITPQAEDIKFLDDFGINMVLGSDTGNDFNFPGYSLHEEMQLLELGGLDPLSIIKMGSLNAAIMLNAQDSLGSVEVGKIANMVLLDKDPRDGIRNTLAIKHVIKRGVVQPRLID